MLFLEYWRSKKNKERRLWEDRGGKRWKKMIELNCWGSGLEMFLTPPHPKCSTTSPLLSVSSLPSSCPSFFSSLHTPHVSLKNCIRCYRRFSVVPIVWRCRHISSISATLRPQMLSPNKACCIVQTKYRTKQINDIYLNQSKWLQAEYWILNIECLGGCEQSSMVSKRWEFDTAQQRWAVK